MMKLSFYRGLGLVSSYRRNVVDCVFASEYCFCNIPTVGTTRLFSSIEEGKTCDEQKISAQGDSFVVSYLVNSCGLSLESAKSRSKFVQFDSTERPDSVLKLLKNHGFTDSQITKLVISFPKALHLDAEKTLLPKLVFMSSIGFSDADSAKLISSCPAMLRRSVDKALIPCYDFLRNILGSDEIVLKCLKRSSWLFMVNLQKVIAAKISILRNHGVPQTHMVQLVMRNPRLLCYTGGRFEEIINKVIALGFDQKRPHFVQAIIAMSQLDELSWESKRKAYKSWGWSEDEFWSAFRKFPYFMEVSEDKVAKMMDFFVNKMGLASSSLANHPHEDKVAKMMDFFVNKMGLASSSLANHPHILSRSLENNVIPRCILIGVLMSRGVLKKDKVNYFTILMLTKSRFLEKFVINYQNSIPELLTITEKSNGPEDFSSFYLIENRS